MGFITKNANILLLFLILISAIALVFSTIFFQSNFDKVNSEYAVKMQELQKASGELNTTLQILQNYRSELTLKSEREKEFTEQYSEVQGEKQKIESEKNELSSQKQTLESELSYTESELLKVKNDLSSKISLVSTLETDLSECVYDKDAFQSALSTKETELDECNLKLVECNCTQ